MPLSGLHVTCAQAGKRTSALGALQPVLAFPIWSETLAVAGTTTQAAPEDGCIFHVKASAESYFAVGAVPDASKTVSTAASSARIHVSAAEVLDVYVKAGDKLAYATA